MTIFRFGYATTPLLFAIALPACAPVAPQTASHAADTRIEIDPGVCFGVCPVYIAGVDRQDRIQFQPIRNTKASSPVERQGADGTFARVAGQLAPLRPARTGETDVSRQCDAFATDLPYYTVRWINPEGVRSIRFYLGCGNATSADTHRRIDGALRELGITDLTG